MSDNRQLGDFNRPVERVREYPDLRLNFSTLGVGRSAGGRQGKTNLEYKLGGYLAGWWDFRKPGGTPTAVNQYNDSNNGTLSGISDVNLEEDNPFDVRDGPERQRPLSATFNDTNTVYLVDNGSGVGDSEYTPSASTTLGFCIQAWVNRTGGSSSDDTIVSLARNNGNNATQTKMVYRLYFEDDDDKLTFRMYEGSAAQTGNYIEEKMDTAWQHDGSWAHILLYVDQTGAASDPGIVFFVNGIRQSSTTTKNSWGGLTLPSPLPPLTIGAQRQVNGSGVFTSNSEFFKGSMSEIAFWKDIPKGGRLVNENAASALYSARKGFYSNKSGILSEPYRLELRRRDSATGSYPTINRTGDRTRLGNYSTVFDDRKTIAFTTSSAVYPQVLNSDSPNFIFPTSSIGTVTRNLRKGVSDGRVEFTPGESLGPFDDSLIALGTTKFYMTGTSPEVMEGFSNPLKSKTQLFFDITPSETLTLTRSPNARFKPLDASAQPTKTGFAYWNASLRRWEQIGTSDPATGADIKFDYAIKGGSLNTMASGTNSYPQQFTPCQHTGFSRTDILSNDNEKLFKQRLYHLIGSPTVSSFAPFKTIYHATSSQTVRMSDYISHPFLLEKIVVKMEGRAQRIHPRGREGAALRHQDDYMFFIYRQERRNQSGSFRGGGPTSAAQGTPTPSKFFRIDSAADVTGSQRFLVCSGAMTFYQGSIPTTDADSNRVVYDYSPYNTPAFSHDFNIPSATTDNWKVGQFTGSIKLEIEPAVASQGIKGRSVISNCEIGSQATRGAAVYHYWPGGTTSKPFMNSTSSRGAAYDNIEPSQYTGKVGVEGRYSTYTFYQLHKGGSPAIPMSAQASRELPIVEIDPRTMRPLGPPINNGIVFGTAGNANVGKAPINDTNHSAKSPYILFPEDEIVFGLEAAIAPGNISSLTGSGNSNGNFGGQNSLSGSKLEIFQSNERQTVIFYGSLVRAGREHHDTINQPLTSDAIHEAIFEPIVDQWDISSEDTNAGTYCDNYVTGNMGASPWPHNSMDDEYPNNLNSSMRGVAGSFVKGTAPNRAGSFQRSVTFFGDSERFYDTLMPDIQEYAKRAGATMLSTGSAMPAIVFDPPEFYIESHPHGQDSRSTMPFPYEGNPQRKVNDSTNMQVVTKGTVGFLYGADSQLQIRQLLFQVGFKGGDITVYQYGHEGARSYSLSTYNHSHPQATGSTGFRYGIQNIVPEYPNAVFRRNHYGQFRDMLEQRRDGRFYRPRLQDLDLLRLGMNNETSVGDPVVMCKFTLSSSNEEVSPYLTTCSNMSFAATSSLPYFDGDIINVTNPTTLKTVAIVKGDLITSVRTALQTPSTKLGGKF